MTLKELVSRLATLENWLLTSGRTQEAEAVLEAINRLTASYKHRPR